MNTWSFSSHAPHRNKDWITSYIKKIKPSTKYWMNTCSSSSHAPYIHKVWITSYIKKINMLRLVVRRYECLNIDKYHRHKIFKSLWEIDRGTRKRSKDKAANELSLLERRPDLLQDLQNNTTSNYWALDILQEPSQAVRTGLRYNKLEKPCYPKYN